MYKGPGGEKQRLRQEIRHVSAGLDPAYRAEASRSITEQVMALEAWRKAKTVMSFVSMAEEPDTRQLNEQALAEGKTLLLPRCLDGRKMAAVPVKDLDGMEAGSLGIPEPRPLPEGAVVPEPEVILVPCMAATPNGVRLGHGAGYYDRFLERHSGMTVCLCFRKLLRADLPAEDTDIPVDQVITDTGD